MKILSDTAKWINWLADKLIPWPDAKPEKRLTYDDIKNLPKPTPTVFEKSEMNLTDDEEWVVDRLGEAWDEFLKLPVYNQDDVDDFRKAIHDAQRIVLSRSGWRQMRPSKAVLEEQGKELDRQFEELTKRRDAEYREFHGMPQETQRDRMYNKNFPEPPPAPKKK